MSRSIGREDEECVHRWIRYGLCVAKKCGHKFVHFCAKYCVTKNLAQPLEFILDVCNDQLDDLFAVLEEEHQKFEKELSLGLKVMRYQCAQETIDANEAFQKYGPNDPRSLEADLKAQICVVPKVCPLEYSKLEKCWKKNHLLALCQSRVESLLQCAFREIYQPAYDIATSDLKEPENF